MTDLPNDLREMADHLWDVEHRINVDDDTQTLKGAAAEIERLRAALVAIRDRDDKNGSLPQAYRDIVDGALEQTSRQDKNEREMAEGTRCDGSCKDGLPCHC